MKYIYLLIFSVLVSCSTKQQTDYLQYVDIMTGTGPSSTTSSTQHSLTVRPNPLTIPAITAPFGMTQWTLQIHNEETDCIAPYYFRGTISQGFRATHWLDGACARDYGSFGIYATSKNSRFRYLPNQRNTMYMLNEEQLDPAHAKVMFPEQEVIAELTATKRCGFFRFSWLDPKNPTIVIDVNNDDSLGYIKIDYEKQEVFGYNPVSPDNGETAGISGYFVAKFDKPFTSFGSYGNNSYNDGVAERQDESMMGAYLIFDFQTKETLKMKIGTSFTNIENARLNLETEISDWNFEETKQNLENDWNKLLGRVEIESDNKNELTKFYTALYHALLQPRLYSDVNGDYPVFSTDLQVKNTADFEFYGDIYAQSTAHAQLPLLSLIAPEVYLDVLKSMLAMYDAGNRLPTFPFMNTYNTSASGDYCAVVLADAALKGFDFNLEKAYEALIKNAMDIPDSDDQQNGKGRKALEQYIQLGYIPAGYGTTAHHFNQYGQTLEYSYADWCAAQLAKNLNKIEDYENLITRAYSYSNVFDEEQNHFAGRFEDGSFATETELKNYKWYVPYDISGLTELYGEEDFSQELSAFIESRNYDQANIYSQHIPYLFNYMGKWDLTQKTVKAVLKNEYDVGPGGLSGLDNAGQLSAWYVFSAMGFYPVCLASNEYQLSSPVFKKVTLHLDKEFYPGKKLILQADESAGAAIYKKISLKGKEHSPIITHDEIKKGGKLIFSGAD